MLLFATQARPFCNCQQDKVLGTQDNKQLPCEHATWKQIAPSAHKHAFCVQVWSCLLRTPPEGPSMHASRCAFCACSVSPWPQRQSVIWCHSYGDRNRHLTNSRTGNPLLAPPVLLLIRQFAMLIGLAANLQAHAVGAEAQLLKGCICGEHITNGLTPSILQPVESPAWRHRTGGSGINDSRAFKQAAATLMVQ